MSDARPPTGRSGYAANQLRHDAGVDVLVALDDWLAFAVEEDTLAATAMRTAQATFRAVLDGARFADRDQAASAAFTAVVQSLRVTADGLRRGVIPARPEVAAKVAATLLAAADDVASATQRWQDQLNEQLAALVTVVTTADAPIDPHNP